MFRTNVLYLYCNMLVLDLSRVLCIDQKRFGLKEEEGSASANPSSSMVYPYDRADIKPTQPDQSTFRTDS